MPEMDGTEAFLLLKAARPDMKVLICSGYGMDDITKNLITSGASGFVQKPFKLRALGLKVREALDN